MTPEYGSRLTRLLLCGLLIIAPAPAAWGSMQLLMFEEPDCTFCLQWDDEVGVVYARTQEGRAAPLVRLQLAGARSLGDALRQPIRYTPTFVLLRDGREIGRITGYPGEAHFWGLLGAMLERHKSP